MITGIPVVTENFVRSLDDNRKVVTTAFLPRYLSQWRHEMAQKTKDEQSKVREALDARFAALQPCLSLLCDNDCLPQEVRYSMSILQSTLLQVKLAMFPSSARFREYWLGDFQDITKKGPLRKWMVP